ncbi:purine-binding chemotaxis protein CheW [Hydrogenivirga caldilitoris]|uniref:Purine-binding chemotaxis protein CheW n=1 Tax=Hydrogenivirga caldilitoris TaxID=246264 RepID=A0A497XQ86_9AQUI|nr:chemotaxis protein CheW [Hydrogenivirga caldilitoris]RLJ71125.1 purine-binding chemotaxis protein CheW [Hydrogenivirga caldilitoris]
MADIMPVGETKPSVALTGVEEFLGISLERELIGIPLKKTLTISKVLDAVKVPYTPSYIVGVINLRGEIIPVLSLKQLLGLREERETTRIVVLDSVHGKAGVLVDRIIGVVRVPQEKLEPNPMAGRYSAFVSNVAQTEYGLMEILDVDRLINSIVKKD